jgi:hypothetical protein
VTNDLDFSLADDPRLRFDPTQPVLAPPGTAGVDAASALPPLAMAVGTRDAAAATAADVPPAPAPVPAPEPAPQPLLAAPGGRTSTVEGSTTTTMRPVVTVQDRLNQATQDQLTEDAAENERKAGEVRRNIAQGQSDHADSEAARLAAEKEEQRRILQEGQEEYDRRLTAYHDRVEKHAGLKFHDFYSSERGGNKVLSAIMAGLGAAAAGPGGHNQALAIIEKKISDDFKLQQANILKSRDELDLAKGDVDMARQLKADKLADLTLKRAAADDAAAAQLRSVLAKQGVPAAEIETDARVIGLHKQAAERRAAFLDNTRSRVQTQTVRRMTEATGAGAGGGHPTGTDVEHVNRLNTDLANLDRTIDTIRSNPKAWAEYRDNAEAWKRKEAAGANSSSFRGARGFFQGVGLADVTPDQGLKTDSAREVHKGMEAVNTSIAKSYGGVVTDGDRSAASASIAAMGSDPKQALKTLQQIRGNLVASRDNFLRNRGGTYSTPQAPAPAAPRGLDPAEVQAAKAWLRSPDAAKDPRKAARVVQVLQQAGAL